MKPWKYTENTFDAVTKESNKKMLSIATDTDSKLFNKLPDPDFTIIYNEYHPIFTSFRDIYNAHYASEGDRKGETLNVETLLSNLAENLPLWEAKVRSVYPEGSPAETAYFPQKRKPFYNGTYEQRIQAVNALGTKMSTDPDGTLVAYAPTVISYYNTLLAARASQQEDEGDVEDFSSSLENQRKLLAIALYGVLGKLMYMNRANSVQIEDYFDMSLLRHTSLPAHTIIIRGKITYGLGTPVVGATVAVQGDNPPAYTTETDEHGRYEFRFDDVQPGENNGTMTVTAQGFQLHEQAIEDAKLGEVTVINITLTQQMQMAA